MPTEQTSERTVIITGASSGIGHAVAKRFVREGHRVVLNGRDEAKLRRAAEAMGAPDRTATFAGDVADPRTGQALADLAVRRFGGVDVLVNNAGIFGATPLLETSEAQLDAFLRTNLKGTFFTTQAVVPAMLARGAGAIIAIGTVLVDQPMIQLPTGAAMSAKGGVHALMLSLAAELSPHRIRVNTVAPGIVRTPLIGEGADRHAALHPLGRIGEPAEIADAVYYLARAEFVTGTVLPVDGGYRHVR